MAQDPEEGPAFSYPTKEKEYSSHDDGESVWSILVKLFVIVLIFCCISGTASDQLNQWDVPDKVFHLMQNYSERGHVQANWIRTPEKMPLFLWDEALRPEPVFLNSHHSPVGVWLRGKT